jgi:tetratricopeptide (TPR) repeat protein
MASDKDPNINIGGNIGGSFVFGNNNIVNAAKPFNDAGTFLPMARNKLFTGRETALKELAGALTGNTNVVITQAITGMGGIGKSQLALEFAYRSLEDKDFVSAHWLNLTDPSQLGAEIAACGRQMGLLNDQAKQPEMVAETLRVWASRGPRLLVLDNYESAADALQTLAPLLQAPTLRLLITARRADFPPELGLRPYALEVFTPPESLEFLQRLVKYGNEQIPDLQTLAETLGHLPLALHLAGHYLREEGVAPAEYLRELGEVLAHESMQAAWFKEMDIASPTAHEQSLLGTFALSWQKVNDEHAQTIFKVTGYLAPNTPIPVEIFAAVLELEEKDRALKRALRQLEKIGLFTTKNDLPVIHPLLAAYARHLNGESTELLEKLAGKLATLSKSLLETGLPARFAPFSLHIATAAEYTEYARLEDADALWNQYGYHLREIADYIGAHAATERSIRISETNLGKNHPHVATGINNLGLVLLALGDLPGARAAFERAIRIYEDNLGGNHPQVAIGVNNLGLVLRNLGDLDGARAAFERALSIEEAAFGKEHPNVARDVNNLGSILRDLGDLHGARTAFENALKIDKAIFGNEHPNVARDTNNLGNVLHTLGDLGGARRAFEHAIWIWEANFGKNHPKVAAGVNNLGLVLRDMGDLNGAHAAFERALHIDEAAFGKEHPNISIRVNNIGLVLQDLGDLNGARSAFERAIKISEAVFGKEHINVAGSINNLSTILHALGDLNGAYIACERSIRISEANFGKNHPQVAIGVLNLGTILQAQGKKEKARACYQRALAIFEQFLPAGHPNIGIAKKWLKSLDDLP